MKIAMIEEDFSIRSGSRRFIAEATPKLEAVGHEVNLFTLRMDAEKCFPELLRLPVEVVPVKPSSVSGLLTHTIRRDPSFYHNHAKTVMEISRRIAHKHPDVVIFHYTGEIWLPPYFYYLDKPIGIVCFHVLPRGVAPFPVTRLREKIDLKTTNMPPIGRWKQRSLKRLGMILSHSRYVHEKISKIRNNERALPGEVVPLGVDHSVFRPTGEEEPFVLCLARIHPQKKLELAVEAMGNCSQQFSLVIAGDVEDRFVWYKEKLQVLARKLGLEDRLRIIPAPSGTDVVSLLQRCAVFLFSGLNETFGVSVLEAMACGKPVIANRSGAVPELLEECGMLLSPEPEQWRSGVSRLLGDANMRRMMGQKAFEKSMAYSWDITVDKLASVLNDFVSSRGTVG